MDVGYAMRPAIMFQVARIQEGRRVVHGGVDAATNGHVHRRRCCRRRSPSARQRAEINYPSKPNVAIAQSRFARYICHNPVPMPAAKWRAHANPTARTSQHVCPITDWGCTGELSRTLPQGACLLQLIPYWQSLHHSHVHSIRKSCTYHHTTSPRCTSNCFPNAPLSLLCPYGLHCVSLTYRFSAELAMHAEVFLALLVEHVNDEAEASASLPRQMRMLAMKIM